MFVSRIMPAPRECHLAREPFSPCAPGLPLIDEWIYASAFEYADCFLPTFRNGASLVFKIRLSKDSRTFAPRSIFSCGCHGVDCNTKLLER